ncbi:glycosyltransferase family 2 protein [Halomonas sp. DP8Y7-3]|uniref:glycosyltransferase family 2 protein n=1 Tax=Halomonas sp. DP8Y7-3 TaxID=2859079 RepID=UPI001C947AFB|nr:glycosyltransferase family A protein [Halomonas sp. DP8Y7-3]MBY5930382.1 glycosyltransferase family 2 protein [Halomonas sp. DP8Y7-3]
MEINKSKKEMIASKSVGIVCRTKNRPQFLKRAIKSIISQEYKNWQCVIVNDGGDSGIVEDVLYECGQNFLDRIRIVNHRLSLGMEAASNVGLKLLDTDFYVIHDDDDSWSPSFLSFCVDALEDGFGGNVQGVVGRTKKVVEIVDGSTIKQKKVQHFLPELRGITIPRIAQSNPFMPIAFVYTREALDKLEGYDEELPVVGDWDFNLRFISQFDIAYVPRAVAYYHVRKTSRGDSSDNSISKELEHQHYRSIIVNRYIRSGIRKGNICLGDILVASEPNIYSNRLGEKLSYWFARIKKICAVSWNLKK